MASPIAWLRQSIAHVPHPRTWPPVALPAVITCSQCSAPCGTEVLITDYVKYLRCSMCGAIWTVPRSGVVQLGDPKGARSEDQATHRSLTRSASLSRSNPA